MDENNKNNKDTNTENDIKNEDKIQNDINQIEKTKEQNSEETKTDSKHKKTVKKNYILIIAIITISIIGIFAFKELTSVKRKVEFTSETIEANKKVDLIKNINVKDKYKENFEVDVKKTNDDYTKLGKHTVTYIIKNKKNGKINELEKEFDVIDTTPPNIILEKEITGYLGEKFNIKKYVKANDIVDGKIKNDNINVKGKVNTTQEGSYDLVVTVKDNSGNSVSKKTTVKIVEKQGSLEELAKLICNGYGYTWLIPNNHLDPRAQFTLHFDEENYGRYIVYSSTDCFGYLNFTYIKSDYSYVKGEGYFCNPYGFSKIPDKLTYEDIKNLDYNKHTYFTFDLSNIKERKLKIIEKESSYENGPFLKATYEESE